MIIIAKNGHNIIVQLKDSELANILGESCYPNLPEDLRRNISNGNMSKEIDICRVYEHYHEYNERLVREAVEARIALQNMLDMITPIRTVGLNVITHDGKKQQPNKER